MILHVITGLGQGGAETALYRLLGGVRQPEHHCVVSLTGGGIYGPRLRDLGVSVICLDMHSLFGGTVGFVRLIRTLRRMHPAVVQTWMYHADLIGGVAAWVAGVPVCWGVRHSNLDPGVNKRSTLWVARLCAWLSGRLPRRIVSCSSRAIDVHRQYGYADRFTFIPNGLELGAFGPDLVRRVQMRKYLGLPLDRFVLGHVGRFHAQKDYPTLMKAFCMLRRVNDSACLLLVGKGLARGNEKLDPLLGEEAGAVVALGPREDVPDLLRAMDVFVLSSLGEGFPNVVAEAMASGVPCVVTDAGDAADLVGETGWVVPVGQHEALASALSEAIGEPPGRRVARGEAARERIAEQFTIERMVQAYEAVWAQAQGST